jgi:hypothetical protein
VNRWYRSERDQGSKEGGQTTPRLNAPAVLGCEGLYAEAGCHSRALHDCQHSIRFILNDRSNVSVSFVVS